MLNTYKIFIVKHFFTYAFSMKMLMAMSVQSRCCAYWIGRPMSGYVRNDYVA